MPGRKPKLTNDKNDRADQRQKTEELIEKTSGLPRLQKTPPSHLKSYARALWVNIVPILNDMQYINQADVKTVELLCINYQIMRESYQDILEHGIVKETFKTVVSPVTGEVVAHDSTGYKRNPATQILDSATAKIKSLSESLGLTPASRAQILSITPDENEDAPSLNDILNKGSGF